MKIAFHGAARTVTGSKHLITLDNGKKLLLDCGMFQGMGPQTDALNATFGFNASEVDYMVLSHAHIDHCGLLPKFVKEGYAGKIYCTPATKDLSAVLMEDSAGIQEMDVKFTNKRNALRGLPPVKPLYTTEDALIAAQRFEAVDYENWHTIEPGLEFCYADAGHIIGSATVHLRITQGDRQTRLTFSGDVGRYRDIILRSPSTFSQADYILIESTYGNSLHDQFTATPDALLDWITRTCLQKKGKLILPAFSVGRTQEILYSLNELSLAGKLPALDYFVDSPLSQKATDIVKHYPQYFNDDIQKVLLSDKDPFDFPGLSFTKSADDSKRLNYYEGPCVIISASGMADAGRVKHHISNNIENSRNSIVMTGYCEPHSLGGKLKMHPKEIYIYGQLHEVNAEIGEIRSMSAHGDYNDLLHWLSCQDASKVKKVFLVHGDFPVQKDFREKILAAGFPQVEIPERHSESDLG
jgi:metallo-beta-lactamase family protein